MPFTSPTPAPPFLVSEPTLRPTDRPTDRGPAHSFRLAVNRMPKTLAGKKKMKPEKKKHLVPKSCNRRDEPADPKGEGRDEGDGRGPHRWGGAVVVAGAF